MIWRHVAANVLTLLVVVLVLVAGAVLWGKARYQEAGPLETAICLRIEPGASFRRISERLAAEGAIASARLFRIGASYEGKADRLKAGSFRIPAAASMAEIADIITRGGASTCGREIVFNVGISSVEARLRAVDPASGALVEVVRFAPGAETLPEAALEAIEQPDTRFRINLAEGVTSWQVVNALKAVPVLSGEIAEMPPEGTLAPDSYEFRRGESRSELLARMAARQARILADAWARRAPDLPVSTPEEALILASIIEKETSRPEERPLVASVFVNRLRRGMRLQTDPSVIYGVTGGKGVLGRGLRQSELRRPTPWNTYVIAGLPKTPIANPGRASIEAAVNPAKTDYLFFVADGSGGHAFAATLAEHNRNVARWRRIEAGRDDQ